MERPKEALPLGAAYLTPDQITEAIRRIRALTDKPLNVNLFAGGYETERHVDPGPMLALGAVSVPVIVDQSRGVDGSTSP